MKQWNNEKPKKKHQQSVKTTQDKHKKYKKKNSKASSFIQRNNAIVQAITMKESGGALEYKMGGWQRTLPTTQW